MWLSVFGGLFIAYQLWGTAIYSARAQSALEQHFDELVAAAPATYAPPAITTPAVTTPAVTTPAVTTPAESTPDGVMADGDAETSVIDPRVWELISRVMNAQPGDGIAKFQFPSIGKEVLVVEGVGADSLRDGPGRYPSTAYLGGLGNAAVAGHRSTYGAPFGDLDKLQPGDEVRVETPLGVAVYEVMDPRLAFGLWIDRVRDVGPGYVVVGPEDGYVLSDVGDNRLTLTACHPRFSASERLIVAARLVSEPLEMLSPGFGLTGPVFTVSADTATASPPAIDRGPSVSPPRFMAEPPAPVVPVVQVSDLREGLSGWSVSLMPTIVWTLTLLVAMVGATLVKYRQGLVVAAAISVVPIAAILLTLFTHLDRLLPAY